MRFADLRPVYVVGIGLSRYKPLSDTPYVALGLEAIRQALTDADLAWPAVDAAYVGSAVLGVAPGRTMLRHLGTTGLSLTQVENASATGSSTVRLACLDVASGESEVALALGIDKPGAALNLAPSKNGVERLVGPGLPFAASFGIMADAYLKERGAGPEVLAAVAAKNHTNGAKNPYAHFQQARTVEEVMAAPAIAGVLTRLQCCPFDEGAAAVLIASEDALKRHGLDPTRAVKVLSSVSTSERALPGDQWPVVELTRETTAMALDAAVVDAKDIDLVELHDAFSVEELFYVEAMGFCPPGEGGAWTLAGRTGIGGDVCISASGGLIAMGHPFGPTGAGQVCELTRQLRGEAGDRQHPRHRFGLAHMVGVGQVCVMHVLQAPD